METVICVQYGYISLLTVT